MGTYLSKPNTKTVSHEGKSRSLSFGVSSMQGWRVTQEDAHTCLPDFDDGTNETSLFGVFDGHGGAEVAEYAAKHLPLWIKKNEFYISGDLEKGLSDSFLRFDQSLVEPHVAQILKDMAEMPSSDEEDERINEAIALKEEAEMPIEELLSKYGCQVVKREELGGDTESIAASSSATACEEKVDAPVEPSANGSASEHNGSKESTEEAKKEPDENGEASKNDAHEVTEEKTNGSEDKELIENKEPIEKLKLKIDKGKGKKIIIPKRVDTTGEKKPLYEKFVEDFVDDDSEEMSSESGDEDEDDDEEDSEDGDEEEEIDDEEDDNEHEVSIGLGEVPGKDSGCTACVTLIRGGFLYVANAGDSRCVVCRDGVAMDMSVDHKPEDEVERARIEKAGGQVTLDGRVNGGLNLSRALGDHTYKETDGIPLKQQMISPEPDVKKLELTEKDEFFIVACDGIWNSMSSQEVVDFIRERIQSKSLVAICEDLFQACLAPDATGDGTGCDNMTAVIVELNKNLKRKIDDEEGETGEKEAEEVEPSKKSKDQEVCSSGSSSH